MKLSGPFTTLLSLFLIPQALADLSESGSWGPSIQVGLVPAAGAVLPETGEVLLWSAYMYNVFEEDPNGLQQTATCIFNPATGNAADVTITNTQHDMFCPGISMDINGRVVVTGGASASKTSIYDATANAWTSGPDMNLQRGYQSSATLSNGNIFTIGGSWNGPAGGKNGEVYDGTSWTLLPGAIVAPMLTNDPLGPQKNDNHAWLFGWKDGTVFQAGPSSAMNWYGTTNGGTQGPAGTRANDPDSMNGNAIMYDAVNGKILTLGGGISYNNCFSTNAAHVITIGDAFTQPTVDTINPMAYSRSYANAVILPNGGAFINGGQTYPVQFTDANSTTVPEYWDPVTMAFTDLAPNTVPRNYHSIGIMLPDATILTGGGGLCYEGCDFASIDHFDVQIFTPHYLYAKDGSLATRPQIKSVSTMSMTAGSTLTIDVDVTAVQISMLRYGTATHTVDTDQRRIVLLDGNTAAGPYTVTLPGNTGVLLPGYYMIFAIDGNGVPSVSTTVLVHL